jgi:hypothetical protein
MTIALLQVRFREVLAGAAAPSPRPGDGERRPARHHHERAFVMLSTESPIVLVALDRPFDLLALIRQTGRFGVNLLARRTPHSRCAS